MAFPSTQGLSWTQGRVEGTAEHADKLGGKSQVYPVYGLSSNGS